VISCFVKNLKIHARFMMNLFLCRFLVWSTISDLLFVSWEFIVFNFKFIVQFQCVDFICQILKSKNEWMFLFCNTQVTNKDDPDAYVPYLAMNYFDRFICRCDMRVTENSSAYFIKVSVSLNCCVKTENYLVSISVSKVRLIPKKFVWLLYLVSPYLPRWGQSHSRLNIFCLT
jgi:hypothetical protein